MTECEECAGQGVICWPDPIDDEECHACEASGQEPSADAGNASKGDG